MNNLDFDHQSSLKTSLFVEELTILKNINNCHSILQQILAWTNGQRDLNRYICHLIVDYAKRDLDEIDREVINQIIRDNFNIDLLENKTLVDKYFPSKPVVRLIERLRNALTQKSLALDLLNSYKELLLEHHKNYNNSIEQNKLIEIGIARLNLQREIVVFNPIYKKIFNLAWVDRELEQHLRQKTLDKYHLALITGLVSLFLFSLFQGFVRYSPYGKLLQCNSDKAFKESIEANIALDEAKIEESIEKLKNIQANGNLSKNCAAILYDLQYSKAIYFQAGIRGNPMSAVETLCEIPDTYFASRNIQPWFTRWQSLYRQTNFNQDLEQYLKDNNCTAARLLKNSN
jgi:hypothetical protein